MHACYSWVVLGYATVTRSIIMHCGGTLLPNFTGDPLHSRAACTQPCNVNTHSRAHCSPGARLCEQWGHGCVNNGAQLCASARLCRGSPVIYQPVRFVILWILNIARTNRVEIQWYTNGVEIQWYNLKRISNGDTMAVPKMSTHIKFREIVYHDISMYSVNFTNSAKCYGQTHLIVTTRKLIYVIYMLPKAPPPHTSPHTSHVVNYLWSEFITEHWLW